MNRTGRWFRWVCPHCGQQWLRFPTQYGWFEMRGWPVIEWIPTGPVEETNQRWTR